MRSSGLRPHARDGRPPARSLRAGPGPRRRPRCPAAAERATQLALEFATAPEPGATTPIPAAPAAAPSAFDGDGTPWAAEALRALFIVGVVLAGLAL